MGSDSKIEWTHHTFNPWRGCTKVSAGCKHCYAETMSKRNPSVLGVWGKHGVRAMAAESYWQQPIAWNAAARKAGERRRVFCASLADVFEGRDTMPESSWQAVEAARARLWDTITATPDLDWLLLTKRPENVMGMIPAAWQHGLPDHVWVGTSIESPSVAKDRLPALCRIPARVRFLSMEPLLQPVDLAQALAIPNAVQWVIVGGESGAHARPMHIDWVRAIRDECQERGIAFFFKQWGEWEPYEADAQPPLWQDTAGRTYDGHTLRILDPMTGGDGAGWQTDLPSHGVWRRVGKKAAGRMLDGRTWEELP